MDKTTPIVVRFSRAGNPRIGVKLTRSRKYRVTVNNEAWETFQSPWSQKQLDKHIAVLRNKHEKDAPRIKKLEAIGQELGKELGKIGSLTEALGGPAGQTRCVIWILGWPELARIPWELATRRTSPYKHILLEDGLTFVRRVPAYTHRSTTQWPTGQKRRLRLLYVWSDPYEDVPYDEHRQALVESCEENDVEYVEKEVNNIGDIANCCENTPFDFVHILAHGAKTEDDQWGLRFGRKPIKGEQLAQALTSGTSIPALVTLASCDSGAELGSDEESSYGSVAYGLHVAGIPMVRASLFRLRSKVSVYTVNRVYKELLAGDHPFSVLSSIRRKLAFRDDESWANEMIYLGDITDTLDQTAAIGRQQGVLRRARVIVSKFDEPIAEPKMRKMAIQQLEAEIDRLMPLKEEGFDLPETFGLLGSLTRRIAYLRGARPNREELRDARKYYEQGFRSNSIAHYPGIDAIHLNRLLGDDDKAKELVEIVRFALKNELNKPKPDHWAFASAGELEVYDGNKEEAKKLYRKFLRRQREVLKDNSSKQHDEIRSAHRQLDKFHEQLSKQRGTNNNAILDAATASMKILKGAFSLIDKKSPRSGRQVKPSTNKRLPESAMSKRHHERVVNAKRTSDQQIYNVHMLPALLGDALWVEYGDASMPHRILIDGGKAGTAKVIKKRIEKVVEREGRPCHLELLVVTHIDADHIEGVLKLLGDATLKDKLIIDDIWFNGEHHLPIPGNKGERNPRFLGARYGEFLSVLIKKRRLKWNHKPWRGNTIYVPKTGKLPRHTLKGGLEIVLLSPTFDTMLKLSRNWEKEIEKAGLADASDKQILEALGHDKKLAPDDEFLSDEGKLLSVDPELVRDLVAAKAKRDTSAANGSSIAFLATYDDRRCLFAGDAHSNVLQHGIDRLLKERNHGEKSLKLGAFKVPHHGSRANIHEGLLKRLDCRHFLVSTDGSQFQHPDREAIAHIIDGAWRPNKGKAVELHFNYHTRFNKTWNKATLMKEFNYKVDFPKSKNAGLKFSVP